MNYHFQLHQRIKEYQMKFKAFKATLVRITPSISGFTNVGLNLNKFFLSTIALVTLSLGVISSVEATLIDAKLIRITQNLNDGSWLMIAEIEAYKLGSATNVALQSNGGSANADSSGFGTVPGDVIDGDTNPAHGGGSVWHSGAPGSGGFVEVTLFNSVDLAQIDIFLRSDTNPHWSSNFQLTVWDSFANIIYDEAVIGYGAAPYYAPVSFQTVSSSVPEPSIIAIFALGIAGIGFARRRRA
ncbi:MAG: hypothetical protein ACI8Z9_001556 [Paraglaciecola sp.]